MKKRVLLIILTLAFLVGCSEKNTVPGNLSLKNSKGQVLYLYMPRKDAEKILGEAESIRKSVAGSIYDYDNITVAYKDNTLAYAHTTDDEWSFSSGIKIGDSKEKCQDFELKERFGGITYKHNDGSYTKITSKEIPKFGDFKYGDYSGADINFKEDILTTISFYDQYAGMTSKFDE